jgi:hypothetical protein
MDNLSRDFFEKKQILMDCVDLEVAASLIYREFTLMFPAEGDFWAQLAREEEDHARLYLAGDILKVTGIFPGIQFPPAVLIERTLEFASQIQELLRNRPISLKEALDMALMLEKTLAESIVFEFPETNNPVIANIRKIITDTEAHVDRIEKFKIEKGFAFLD